MKKIMLLFFFIYVANEAKSQFKYTGKMETGYHIFLSRPIRVDPGPGWKGYQLDKMPGGFEVGMVNGVSFKGQIRLGLGVNYLNYESINGHSIFGDLEYATSKGKVSPVFNLKIGRSHINNQYENGSTDFFVDISGGIENAITNKLRLQFKVGFRVVHQSIFLPIRIGARF